MSGLFLVNRREKTKKNFKKYYRVSFSEPTGEKLQFREGVSPTRKSQPPAAGLTWSRRPGHLEAAAWVLPGVQGPVKSLMTGQVSGATEPHAPRQHPVRHGSEGAQENHAGGWVAVPILSGCGGRQQGGDPGA